MTLLKKILLSITVFVAVLYIALCCLIYFYQEKMIFHPTALPAHFKFHYNGNFTEVNISAFDGKNLHGLLFKSDSSKGLVFYLHGNAGALDTWGDIADTYTALNYDIFILDYRGFGKSEGIIFSEEQFYKDVQAAYDLMKKDYPENKIAVVGYSIGTGPAAMLAANNNPKQLILQAPYYNLTDVGEHMYPSVTPNFLLKYKFTTNEFIQKTKAPVAIFHGDSDQVIYYGSALKLKDHFKPGDTLFTLQAQGHGHMNENEVYQKELTVLLN
ncbi:MAG: alpha/beta fold hydrolase [Bacteroidota bacterium]